MTNQSLDGQLEKKEVEIPLPLKERLPENLEDIFGVGFVGQKSDLYKKLQLKVNLTLSKLYPVYRKQPMVASESAEKATNGITSTNPS